jgi:hypothetical protein
MVTGNSQVAIEPISGWIQTKLDEQNLGRHW